MSQTGAPRDDRAVSPIVGVVLLVGITVVVAGAATGVLVGIAPPEPGATVLVDVEADPSTDAVAVRHVHGDALDVSKLSVRLSIGEEPLEEQPPVPFFSAAGFDPGPTGPFNAASDGEWSAGESGTVRIASTNDPGRIEDGDRVDVTLVYDEHVIAEERTTAYSGTVATVVMAMSGLWDGPIR